MVHLQAAVLHAHALAVRGDVCEVKAAVLFGVVELQVRVGREFVAGWGAEVFEGGVEGSGLVEVDELGDEAEFAVVVVGVAVDEEVLVVGHELGGVRAGERGGGGGGAGEIGGAVGERGGRGGARGG